MNEDKTVQTLAQQFGRLLQERAMMCVLAESCTGGGLAAAVTDIAGSSQWFDRGFVTYTNKAKQEMLSVPASMLLSEGAVSESTVCAMAKGALNHSHAQFSIAVSGIAGPAGGSIEKPVGTVWIAWAIDLHIHSKCYLFSGNRQDIRRQTVLMALEEAVRLLENHSQESSD